MKDSLKIKQSVFKNCRERKFLTNFGNEKDKLVGRALQYLKKKKGLFLPALFIFFEKKAPRANNPRMDKLKNTLYFFFQKTSFKTVFWGSALAMLVFFSISFLTVLARLAPFHYYKNGAFYQLEIGFPLRFYREFWLRGNDRLPNSDWAVENLLIDIVLTWLFVTSGCIWVKNRG